MINPDDFEVIDIDNRDENFTDIELNEILHNHTKTVTNNDELTRQLIDFCKYISYVKDETLLNGAIDYVKKNVPINLNNFDSDFKQITVSENFSDNDLIKIKAIYFSLVVRYEIMVIKENPPQMEPPIFDFYIDADNKLVYFNLRFVLNQIRNNYDVGFVEYTHKKPLNEAMPTYIDYITELQNAHHRRLEVNTERILFITNAKNNYLERQQYLNNQPQPPTPPEDDTSEDKQENQFAKNIPMQFTIEHFSKLKKKNKKGNVFLTDEKFDKFIKCAFLNEKIIEKQKIDFERGESGKVIGVFYDYFDLACKDYGQKNSKEPFINLVFKCFDNWEITQIKSFFKPNKTKDIL